MLGKLSTKALEENVLSVIKKRRKEVIATAAIGEDCAVLKLDGLMIVTSDPITAAVANMGNLAITVSSNDIAASGGEPIAAFLTLIAPEGTALSSIKHIMKDAETTASKLNIEIAGGHTEFSDAVNRSIISCTMIGKPISKIYKSSVMKIGDSILLTRSIAREYTAIMIEDSKETMGLLSPKEVEEARLYIHNLSVIPESRALSCAPISSMHDVTEGGVLGALEEMLYMANLGANVLLKNISISQITRKVCKHFNVDPCRVISSGNMLVITDNPKEVIRILTKNKIEVAKIGDVVAGKGIALK